MSKLLWDQIGERLYETGVKKGVLFVRDATGAYPAGVAWNGLVNVTESPSGAEPTKIYADDITYVTFMSPEELGITIEAYTYPDEFAACDGSDELAPGVKVGQQTRKPFGMAYQTTLGNDVDSTDHGYKLHLVYGGIAAPSEKAFNTINESPEAITFSWEVATTPVDVPDKKPTSLLTIDSTKVDAIKLAAFEAILFGADAVTEPPSPAVVARLPLPAEVLTLLAI